MDHQKNRTSAEFKIGGRWIGEGNPVFVIAEVGINHRGDFDLCARLIEAAAEAGADAVKLQTIKADDSYVAGTVSYAEFKGKELSLDHMRRLVELSNRAGVALFSTPGDFSSLDMLVQAGMQAAKVSSGLMTNLPLISEIGKRKLPTIISTGMAYEDEIEMAANTALENGAPGIAILKCTAIYPAPDDTINLRAISTMRHRFPVAIGYSDHTLDELACVSAVALGASVIEKHFTLNKALRGEDHAISMEPKEFAAMVGKIRRLEMQLGRAEIKPVEEEIRVREQRHRCLVARENIAEGALFTKDNVGLKRPLPGAVGLSPIHFEKVLGRHAAVTICKDTPITFEQIR